MAETLEAFGLPAAWAVVGHLFEHDCTGAHVGHPTPFGWFAHERGDDPIAERYRFAPDLLGELIESDIDYDIGAHIDSHVDFSADYATESLARAECDRAAEAAGLSMASFVFPRNRVGHQEVLAESGFRCYRETGPETTVDRSYSAPLRRLVQATVVREPPPLVDPTVDEYGLVSIPASLYLFGFGDRTRRVLAATVGDPALRQARLGVDAAADGEGVCRL